MALVLEEVDAAAGIDTTYSMKLGDLFRASLSASDDRDWIEIEGGNGLYLIYLTKNGEPIKPVRDYVRAFDESGSDITGYKGAKSISAKLPEGESLYIEVSGVFELLQGKNSDTYTLSVNSTEDHSGTTGDDTMVGSFLNDVMFGEEGNDTMIGNGGEDRLLGGDGDDRFDGGRGRDFIYAGEGNETFIYDSVKDSRRDPAKRDKIFDFEAADDDVIDLSRIDAKGDGGADDTFVFIGDAAFSGTAGEVRFVHNRKGTDTFVYADVNGDGRGEFSIWLDDHTADLTAEAFIL